MEAEGKEIPELRLADMKKIAHEVLGRDGLSDTPAVFNAHQQAIQHCFMDLGAQGVLAMADRFDITFATYHKDIKHPKLSRIRMSAQAALLPEGTKPCSLLEWENPEYNAHLCAGEVSEAVFRTFLKDLPRPPYHMSHSKAHLLARLDRLIATTTQPPIRL